MTNKVIGADDTTGELPAVVETRIQDTIDAAVGVETNRAEGIETALDGRVDVLEATAARMPVAAGADGQLLRWDAATGKLVWTNPVGQSEIASAANTTGATTNLSAAGGAGSIVPILFTAISISNSNGRAVTLEYEANFLQTVAGAGTLFLLLYETTSGASLIGFRASPLPNATSVARQQVGLPTGHKPIGVVSSTRTFELRAYIYAEAANSPSGSILNAATQPTILRAIAG